MNSSNSLEADSFTLLICDVIDTCAKCLAFDQRINLLQLLKQLQVWRNHYGYNDSSILDILNKIGKQLEESSLSQFSHYFYLEQLRIEELYLGCDHPDLADTMNIIGQVYAKNDQFTEAAECFADALLLLEKNKKQEGQLYSLILHNMGLVQYHQSRFDDAIESFNLALKVKEKLLGELNYDVAEMHLDIGKLMLECGKIDMAIDSFLKALLIIRMIMGNDCLKVSEILYHIGLSHKVNGEYIEALNSFYQSLHVVTKSFKDETRILILHQIALTYQYMEDIDNVIRAFQEIICIIKGKVGESHVSIAVVLGLLRNLYLEQGMAEECQKATENIKAICCDACEQSPYSRISCEFLVFVIDIFGHVIDDIPVLAAAAA